MPLCAGLLDRHLGQPSGIGVPKHTPPDASNITQADFEAMTRSWPSAWPPIRTIRRVADAGPSYKALERYPEAVKALQEADRRKPTSRRSWSSTQRRWPWKGAAAGRRADAIARTGPQDRPE